METQVISDNIQKKIKRLDSAPQAIKERAGEAALGEANYEKELGKVIASLESGQEYTVDGIVIKDTVATVRKEKAKAICYEARLKMIEAQLLYKAAVKNSDIICAQLNGWQSVLRYWDKT